MLYYFVQVFNPLPGKQSSRRSQHVGGQGQQGGDAGLRRLHREERVGEPPQGDRKQDEAGGAEGRHERPAEVGNVDHKSELFSLC